MPRLRSQLISNRTGLAEPSRPADATSSVLDSVTRTTIWRSLTRFLTTLAFWTAIALPALYLPLLIAGLDTTTDLFAFLGLFTLHVVALLLGRSHLGATAS